MSRIIDQRQQVGQARKSQCMQRVIHTYHCMENKIYIRIFGTFTFGEAAKQLFESGKGHFAICDGEPTHLIIFYPIQQSTLFESESLIQVTDFEAQIPLRDRPTVLSNIEKLKHYPKRRKVTYAIMHFDEREHYIGRYETLFVGNFFKGGDEHWHTYKVYNGEFPSDEDLQSIKGIICPGSYRSVYETDLPHIEDYKQFIRKVYQDYKNIKMVGICFGHQVIAEALGGKVAKMTPTQSPMGLYTGKETVQLSPSFFSLPYIKKTLSEYPDESLLIKNLSHSHNLHVLAVHQDHVLTLAPHSTLLGSSSRTPHEMYDIDNRIFCLQSHPEFNEFFTLDVLMPRLMAMGRYNEGQEREIKASSEDMERPIMRQFALRVIFNQQIQNLLTQ